MTPYVRASPHERGTTKRNRMVIFPDEPERNAAEFLIIVIPIWS